MTAVLRGPATTFLLRAGVIAGILAILAGIFGMHVMTGNHTMHTSAAAHAPAPAVSSAATHTGHQSTADHGEPSTLAAATVGQGHYGAAIIGSTVCACSGDCASVHAMSDSCIPTAKTGTLAAPEPGQGTLSSNTTPLLNVGHGASYTYLPGGPSPGELSISRT